MPKIKLIGYGQQDAVPASQLKPGDTVVWNYGLTSKVVSVTGNGKSSILTFRMESSSDHVVRERRMKKTRLVAIQ